MLGSESLKLAAPSEYVYKHTSILVLSLFQFFFFFYHIRVWCETWYAIYMIHCPVLECLALCRHVLDSLTSTHCLSFPYWLSNLSRWGWTPLGFWPPGFTPSLCWVGLLYHIIIMMENKRDVMWNNWWLKLLKTTFLYKQLIQWQIHRE